MTHCSPLWSVATDHRRTRTTPTRNCVRLYGTTNHRFGRQQLELVPQCTQPPKVWFDFYFNPTLNNFVSGYSLPFYVHNTKERCRGNLSRTVHTGPHPNTRTESPRRNYRLRSTYNSRRLLLSIIQPKSTPRVAKLLSNSPKKVIAQATATLLRKILRRNLRLAELYSTERRKNSGSIQHLSHSMDVCCLHTANPEDAALPYGAGAREYCMFIFSQRNRYHLLYPACISWSCILGTDTHRT